MLFDNDGRHVCINSSVSGSDNCDHYSYIEMEVHQQADEVDTVEQLQPLPADDYQGLDPSVVATLRQPPVPSVYASLSPDVPVMRRGVNNTGPSDANPDNSEGFNLTSLLPRENADICNSSENTGSAAQDDVAVQPRPGDCEELDPSVLGETLRQTPALSVYASLSANVPDVSQEVNNPGPDGTNYEGLDQARVNEISLPSEYAGIIRTLQATESGPHDYLELIADPQEPTDT